VEARPSWSELVLSVGKRSQREPDSALRIRFVLAHPTNGAEGREVFLADALNKQGHDAAYFAISPRNLHESRRRLSCPIEFFPPDNPGADPHLTISTALLQALCADRPDIVLVKGIDYSEAALIFDKFPRDRCGVVIGGASSHPLLDQAGFIYFETQTQLDRYRGTAPAAILPKYIDWEALGKIDVRPKTFDVINVGNFNEPRKSQEFMFALAHRHSIVFVGGGARLAAFRKIARDNRNVTFTGRVDRNAVFGWLSSAYLMIHCSTWDGYPRAVAESLAAGVPVIGLTGVLDGITSEPFIRCASAESLTAVAAQALSDRDALVALGRRARDHMLKTSAADALLNSFLALLPHP
jgi:glycosyltransferase involved in cell wall biosynthesis